MALHGSRFGRAVAGAMATTTWMTCTAAPSCFVYQTPNKKVTGFESLKVFIEAEGCEVIFTADAPPELNGYETMRITQRQGQPIPPAVVKRCHSWAHQRNYLHSFFKPMYR